MLVAESTDGRGTASDWPGQEQAAIALAARVVMLSAASETCHLGSLSPAQKTLLSLLPMATAEDKVEGEDFPEYLQGAKDRLDVLAKAVGLDKALPKTLEDVAACPPVDPIADVFDHLVALASEVYGAKPLGQKGEPTLVRETMPGKATDRPTAIRGQALRRRDKVVLVLHLDGFDLTSLALVPRILAHELVCHIAARDTGGWPETPDPDVRFYFPDGFMDRASWILLLRWLHAGEIPRVTPIGHLTVTELEYAADKPEAFQAGIVAFENCVDKTSKRVKSRAKSAADRHALIRSRSEDRSIRTALRLNFEGADITRKDLFVHQARDGEIADRFARIAAGRAKPEELFEHVTS